MTTTRKKAATQPKVDTTTKTGSDGAFLSTFRSGMGVIEHTSLSAAEIPLKVLSTLGLPKQATDVAREGHRQMVHGIHGTLNAVATQTANATGKSVSLITGVVGGSSKS